MDQATRRPGRIALWWPASAAVVGLGGVSLLLATAGGAPQRDPSAGQAEAASTSTVRALARLEPAAGLIVVGARPGTRVEAIVVAEGQDVKSGDPLARLEGHAQAQAQVKLAEVKKRAALEQRSRHRRLAEIERARADRLAKAQIDTATRASNATSAYFQKLSDASSNIPAAATLSDRGMLENAVEQARARDIEATLALQKATIATSELAAQRAIEDEALADGGAEDQALDAEIELDRAQLASATVTAPQAGTVLKLIAHAGEVSQGPLLHLADTTAMVARAEVDQADIPRLAVGDTATVQVLDQSLEGRVSRIGRLVAPNQVASVDPRARQDHRVIDVVITLDDPAVAARFVNMQVEVAITPGASSGGSEP